MHSPVSKAVIVLAILLLPCMAVRAADPEQNPHLSASRALAEEALHRMKEGSHYPEAERRAWESAQIAEKIKTEMTEEVEKTLRVRDTYGTKKATAKLKPAKEKFYLVISSSVPEETLRSYMAQIEDLAGNGVEIVPVLRGFVGGMKKIRPTIEFYLKIALKDPSVGLSRDNLRPVAISVDPGAARGVSAVPALKTKDGSCTVYGDAPLDFLLQKLRSGECGKKFGTTFEFAEKNALDEIKEATLKNFPSPEEVKPFFKRKLKNLVELRGNTLPPAGETLTRQIEPSFTLPFDVKDPETGKILYPRGFTFNPLEYIPDIPFQVLLINGNRNLEVAFAGKLLKKNPYLRIRALEGNIAELSEKLESPVLSGIPYMTKGWCSATPCLIERKGNFLRVTQFAPEDMQKLTEVYPK